MTKYSPGELITPWGHTPPKGPHLVAGVKFLHNTPSEQARIRCQCGHRTTVRNWQKHSPRLGVRWAVTEPGWHEQRGRKRLDDD